MSNLGHDYKAIPYNDKIDENNYKSNQLINMDTKLLTPSEYVPLNILPQTGSIVSLQKLQEKAGDIITNTAQIKTRTVLWYLVFTGFAINYMIRININITIVDMVRMRRNLHNGHKSSECFDTIKSTVNESLSVTVPSWGKERFSLEREFLKAFQIPYESEGFSWNEAEQGLVLGSFFWLHWLTQIPGGILARKYGTKLIFGLANFIGCIMCLMIPIIAYWSLTSFIIFRVVQGLICGLAWPSMHHMTSQWIPPDERSKFVTAYLGSSVGVALFFPLFGYVIAWSSWEWVFHFCGIIGSVWFIGWQYFVYDTPADHPRIDPTERIYIEKSLGGTVGNGKHLRPPWCDILKSRPVWMLVIAQWGGIWGLFTLMTQGPTYFKVIHGWDIQTTGLLSGLPHLMRILFACAMSVFGDWMLRKNKLSRTNVRKLAGTFCCTIMGLYVLALSYSGCNSTVAVTFLTLATASNGAVSTGPLAGIVDISPNFSSLILGLSGMIGVLPGFISPIIVGYLTLGNQTIAQWKIVFQIAAGMLIGSGILYLFFSSSELQPWNNPDYKRRKSIDLKTVEYNSIDKNEIINSPDKEDQK